MKLWPALIVCLIFPFPVNADDCVEATRLTTRAFDLGSNASTFAEQKELLRQALRLCPNHAEAHNNLASILEEENDFEGALHHYKQAIDPRPDFAAAWFGVGEVYAKTNRFPLALEAYLKGCRDMDARERVRSLLDSNRYRVTEKGEILDKESLLLLFDKNRREKIRTMISECGFRASVVPQVVFRNLLFDTGSAEIQPGSIPQIREIGSALLTIGQANVNIAGHTDRRPFHGHSQSESDELNLKLSQARADSVADYLVQMGVSRERVRAVGFGPTRPEVNGDTSEAYEKNRRVVIVVGDH